MALSDKQKRRVYKIANMLPDKLVVNICYFADMKRWPCLKNPQRFTEKLQWYKLYYHDPLMTECADKYRLRYYLKRKGYEQYLPALYQVCDVFADIDFDMLPSAFAIKCNNGSGTNFLIKDKENVDVQSLTQKARYWKNVNTISLGREWAYKNIPQKIIVEELLVSTDGTQADELNDYKIMCFNGEPKVIWVDTDRHTVHKRNFYDLQWNKLDVVSDCPNCTSEIPRPFGLEKMLEISKDIAQDFPFVRVDFYSVNQNIYIGELTFYPWSGVVQYTPDSFDYTLGSYFTLPEVRR